MGRLLIFTGVILVAVGLLITFLPKSSLPFGRLPGDIVWRRNNTTVYFPFVTCLVLSIVISLVLWFFNRR
jgi:hypothetical protein